MMMTFLIVGEDEEEDGAGIYYDYHCCCCCRCRCRFSTLLSDTSLSFIWLNLVEKKRSKRMRNKTPV